MYGGSRDLLGSLEIKLVKISYRGAQRTKSRGSGWFSRWKKPRFSHAADDSPTQQECEMKTFTPFSGKEGLATLAAEGRGEGEQARRFLFLAGVPNKKCVPVPGMPYRYSLESCCGSCIFVVLVWLVAIVVFACHSAIECMIPVRFTKTLTTSMRTFTSKTRTTTQAGMSHHAP